MFPRRSFEDDDAESYRASILSNERKSVFSQKSGPLSSYGYSGFGSRSGSYYAQSKDSVDSESILSNERKSMFSRKSGPFPNYAGSEFELGSSNGTETPNPYYQLDYDPGPFPSPPPTPGLSVIKEEASGYSTVGIHSLWLDVCD
jgi:hypothetical protein